MAQPEKTLPFWQTVLAPYAKPNHAESWRHLIIAFLLYLGIWGVMLWSLKISYFLTLFLALPAAGLVMRLFIFQHDCGHGSFFKNPKLNNTVGFLLGIITVTPYHYWRRTHAIHHSSAGDLERRTYGDIATLTVAEYQALSPWKKFTYRLYRSTFILLAVAPTYQFHIKHRFPLDIPFSWTKEWMSVLMTNLALVAVLLGAWATIGLKVFFMVYAPIFLVTGLIGIYLFYVQHQFEDTYWRRRPDWNPVEASLQGSSFLKLPQWLHWFSGNIGYHHIHHLASRIPCYRLPAAMEAHPALRQVPTMTIGQSLRCLRFKLWDEEKNRLVGFRDLKTRPS
jgi:acyl-lipid omega-6 desaturase (Delta-12 desaturase)